MTRLEKLEAVAEAARCWASAYERNAATWSHVEYVNAALAALDAHAEAPQTVTLAAWRNPRGAVLFSVAGTDDDHCTTDEWTRLGTVTLPITREGGR